MVNHTIPIILDTDPGIDDAIALMAALFDERITLKLITTVAGNVSISKTTQNTLKLLEFFGKNVPVAQGAASPLLRQLQDASDIHGDSGLGDYPFPTPTLQLLKDNAYTAMHDVLQSSSEKITLVAIGPLTNIALLLKTYPECKQKIAQIVLMGGSAGRGNFSPNAEFNIAIDPEAAAIVFNSGLPLVMCGLDVTHRATIDKDTVEQMRLLNNSGKMLYQLFQHYRGGSIQAGFTVHDFCAIAYLIQPNLFITQETFVTIETKGEYTSGTTVVDLKNRWKRPTNTTICLDVDITKFRTLFIDILHKAS